MSNMPSTFFKDRKTERPCKRRGSPSREPVMRIDGARLWAKGFVNPTRALASSAEIDLIKNNADKKCLKNILARHGQQKTLATIGHKNSAGKLDALQILILAITFTSSAVTCYCLISNRHPFTSAYLFNTTDWYHYFLFI